MTTYAAAQIIAIGGNEWTKDTHHRVYLNGWAAMVGLEADLYKSGNISWAALDGQRISNARAYKLLSGKVFWENGSMHAQGVHEDMVDRLWPAVATAVAALEPTVVAVPEIIATLRTAGRSAREIADAVGVHVSTVYRWARGRFRPTAARAAALTALTN